MNSSAPQMAQRSMTVELLSACPLKIVPEEGILPSNDRVCWAVTRGLESYLTTWPIQGWRPPDADTAIRPLRVDGWPAPTATLVRTSRTVEVFSSCIRFVSQRGK